MVNRAHLQQVLQASLASQQQKREASTTSTLGQTSIPTPTASAVGTRTTTSTSEQVPKPSPAPAVRPVQKLLTTPASEQFNRTETPASTPPRRGERAKKGEGALTEEQIARLSDFFFDACAKGDLPQGCSFSNQFLPNWKRFVPLDFFSKVGDTVPEEPTDTVEGPELEQEEGSPPGLHWLEHPPKDTEYNHLISLTNEM